MDTHYRYRIMLQMLITMKCQSEDGRKWHLVSIPWLFKENKSPAWLFSWAKWMLYNGMSVYGSHIYTICKMNRSQKLVNQINCDLTWKVLQIANFYIKQSLFFAFFNFWLTYRENTKMPCGSKNEIIHTLTIGL